MLSHNSKKEIIYIKTEDISIHHEKSKDNDIDDNAINSKDNRVYDNSINSKDNLVDDNSINSKDNLVDDNSINSKDNLVDDNSINSKDNLVDDNSINSKDNLVDDNSINSKDNLVDDNSINSKDNLVYDNSINSKDNLVYDNSINSKDYDIDDNVNDKNSITKHKFVFPKHGAVDIFTFFNISTVLNNVEQDYVATLINTDHCLILELQNIINEILSDGKIDIQDIPNILLCVSKIYSLYLQGSFKFNRKKMDIFKIIKFITELIIHSYVDNSNNIDIILYNNIINVSIELLKIDPHVFINKCNFSILNVCCKKRNHPI